MGKFKTENVLYPCREQSTEDLLFDADVHWHNGERKDAVDVLFSVLCDAVRNNDQQLIDECLKRQNEMRNQFCSFIPSYTASEATDNHNRPSELPGPKIPDGFLNVEDTDEEEWDDTYDYIFDKKIKPWEVKKAIDSVPSSEKIKRDRRFYYVCFRILKVIRWIPMETSESDYLHWVNLHFTCGWGKNKNKKKAFLFSLEGTVAKLDDLHPSDWKDDTLYSDLGKHYRLLALSFKNKFTQTMVKDFPVDDSDSYEHLKDRVNFLRGAHLFFDRWAAPPEAYINNGK